MLPFERIGNHACRADFATSRALRVGVEVGVAFCLYHRTGSARLGVIVSTGWWTFCCLHSVHAFLCRAETGL